jgi:SNF2 family DNA or RNA helicase
MQPNFIVNDGHIYLRYRPELHAVLPHGAVLDIPQGKVIAIPHGIDEVKVLKNMGIEVSAPILHQYDWCGGKPFETQALTAAFITQNRRCFVTNQVGTGKTAAALYAFDYLKRRGEAKRLLVVAPLSTLNPTWRRECLLRTPHLSLQVLRGTKAQRLEVLAIPSDIYVINHDGVGVVIEELIKRLDIDMVVIDELTAFKNARADRSKNIQKVCASRKWVVGMTGTPASNDVMDVYGQIKAVLGSLFKMQFTTLRETLCTRSGPYKWLPRPNAAETVARLMQPNVRYTRADTYELPPCSFITREVSLTPVQTQLLKTLRDEGAAMVASEGVIRAVNEAALLGKMLQVVLGGVYGEGQRMIKVDASPRYTELMDILEQLDGNALIFTPYKESVRQLAEVVRAKYDIGLVTGDVPPTERDEIFAKFQGGQLDHIVAHPGTMSHGLTLTAAQAVIWFGPPGSLETYEQANGRITRKGQTSNQLIYHIIASPLERRIFNRLDKKQQLQNLILDILKDME